MTLWAVISPMVGKPNRSICFVRQALANDECLRTPDVPSGGPDDSNPPSAMFRWRINQRPLRADIFPKGIVRECRHPAPIPPPGANQIPIPRLRPRCQSTAPPGAVTPVTQWPSCCSNAGRQGTSRNPSPSSIIANRPDASVTRRR